MNTHTIYLPLSEEVSANFKNFVSKMQNSSHLPLYLALFNEERLTFFPRVTTVGGDTLKRASIALTSLSLKKKEEISIFVSKFNMLASITSGKNGKKCTFRISLSEMAEETTNSSMVLVVELSTNDLATSMVVDNLFKVL